MESFCRGRQSKKQQSDEKIQPAGSALYQKSSKFLPTGAGQQGHNLAAAFRVSSHDAPQSGGLSFAARRACAPHGHAQVLRFDDHRHTVGFQIFKKKIRNLSRKPFLNLGTARKAVYDPGKFG